MITQDDLATLVIKRVIFTMFHKRFSDGGAKPQLSDVETKVDASQKAHLKTKLTTRVLNSIKAYPVQFLATTASPVPKQARLLTKSSSHSRSSSRHRENWRTTFCAAHRSDFSQSSLFHGCCCHRSRLRTAVPSQGAQRKLY